MQIEGTDYVHIHIIARRMGERRKHSLRAARDDIGEVPHTQGELTLPCIFYI